MNSKLLGPAALLVLLGGCADQFSVKSGPIDAAGFGEANRQTYAAMVVDPDPQYSEPMATSAERAAAAIERYRTGEVEEAEAVSSTESASGGGS